MKFFQKKLKNGIVVLHEYRDLPVVSCSISNPFGASHEDSEIKGIAHFIEHLVFTGTKTRSHEDISREIEKKGGMVNAFTSNDVTSFLFKLPAEHLFSGLDILSDILNNPIFDEKKFEKEKKVVIEEIKMYHDAPQRHVYDKLFENLYEKPMGEGIIGSEKTISALNRDFVAKFFAEKYSPDNYIVTIVGKADFKKVCDYLEKTFKPKKRSSQFKKIILKNAKTIERRPGLDQAHYIFGIHAPLANDKRRYVLEVLDAYLANGMSSRLFLKIREERGLAYSVKSSLSMEKTHSYYSIYVGTTKEAIPEVERTILQELKNISKMTEKDLEEAKQRLIGLRKISSEESMEVMNELMFSELTTKAKDYYEHEKNIKKVTLAEVKSMAKIHNYSSAAIVPQ